MAHPPAWTKEDATKAKAFVAKARRGQKAMFAKVVEAIEKANDGK
jgi:hypothetical protein